MAVPINTDAGSAILLVPGEVVTQQVFDTATVYQVVYKYENDTGQDQVFTINAYNEDFPAADAGYRPQTTIYEGAPPDDNWLTFNYPMAPVELPILAGQTFYFWIYDDEAFEADYVPAVPGDYSPSNLIIEFEVWARFDAPGVQADTRLLITSASTDSTFVDIGILGLMAAIIDPYLHLSDPADSGDIIGFVPYMVCGEGGEVFQQSDRILLVDEYAITPPFLGNGWYPVVIYDPDTFEQLSVTHIQSTQTPPVPARAAYGSASVYILTKNVGGLGYLGYFDHWGAWTELHQVDATLTGGARTAIVMGPSGIVYIGTGFPQGEIRKWDTTAVFPDPKSIGELTPQVDEHFVTDLLYMDDGSIIACWFRMSVYWGGSTQMFVRSYAIDGSVNWTYTPTLPGDISSTDPRLGYSHDPFYFWVWNHLESGQNYITKVHRDTGEEVTVVITADIYTTGTEQPGQEMLYTSDSCPILELVYEDVGSDSDGSDDSDVVETTGTLMVLKAELAEPSSDTPVFTFTMSPPDAFDPSTFTLEPGESMTFTDVPAATGYGVSEAPLAGWDLTSTVVNNGSASVNLTVAVGETVTVTFTNAPDVCECCVSTRLQITNQALAKLGQTRFITDLDEATAEGYTAAQLWDLALRAALRHYDWPFATKYAGGADATDGYMNLVDGSESDWAVENEWTYAYRYPLDCLKARRLVKDGGVGRAFDPDPIPFRVGRTWTGVNDVPLIYCNVEDAVLEYTALVECSEDFFDALFEDALGWRLAGMMAPGLTRTAKTAAECMSMFLAILDMAKAVAAQEVQQDPHGEASWTRARE